ncbi:MAG: hypothetical protein JXB29_02660 [Sedimentisphaerales bacterium]|nr:hypothetical protein [Sedimentisphaerales bacterium]
MQEEIKVRGRQLMVPPNLTWQQFNKGIEDLMLIPGLPDTFMVSGQPVSWSELSNKSSRYLLWQKI